MSESTAVSPPTTPSPSQPASAIDENDLLTELRSLRQRPAGMRTVGNLTIARRLLHAVRSGSGISDLDLERILGRNDLLRLNFLERGLLAARAVCRLRVSPAFGCEASWATGFLIAPGLLMTNFHVIDSIDVARQTTAEFGYESDVNGKLRTSHSFSLEPERAFLADATLDFAVVAVAPRSDDGIALLKDYGFLRLSARTNKILESECVTIVQHPNREEKCIALRANEVMKIGAQAGGPVDSFIWYATDTDSGSSGSPAFNDWWQVVSLHHRSIAETRTVGDRTEYQLVSGDWVSEEAAKERGAELRWIANEGIRVSKLLERIAAIHNALPADQRSKEVQELLDDAQGVRPFAGTSGHESIVCAPATPSPSIVPAVAAPSSLANEKVTGVKQRPLSYYAHRKGYDPRFLGTEVALPELTDKALQYGRPAPVVGSSDNVLRYTHFSVVLNATRRMAYFTAVNIDGKRWQNIKRGDADVWYYDPRVPLEAQIGEELYGKEPPGERNKGWFDRGHLVRRQDPDWGSLEEAELADLDTFHWANCSPQYWAFNQGSQLWQGLENYILSNTDDDDLRASVFSGPVFQLKDQEHRGVPIPHYFWKVVVVADSDKALFSSGYVVSQAKWAQDLPFEELPVNDFNNFQVSIAKIQERTGLAFPDAVLDSDVLKGSGDRRLRGLADIQHPRRGRSKR